MAFRYSKSVSLSNLEAGLGRWANTDRGPNHQPLQGRSNGSHHHIGESLRKSATKANPSRTERRCAMKPASLIDIVALLRDEAVVRMTIKAQHSGGNGDSSKWKEAASALND